MSIRLKSLLDGAAALAMIGASGSIIWIALSRQPPAVIAPASETGTEGLRPLSISASALLQGAEIKGQSTAKVLLIEFTDFQCPFCGQYARDVFPELTRDFVDTGQIRYVVRNYPLDTIHPFAARAAAAAHCAGTQGSYWQMHDRLFLNQKELTDENLRAYAADIGLKESDFASCVDTYLRQDSLRADRELAKQLGVNSTPTFFLGVTQSDEMVKIVTRLKGAQPYASFKRALADAVKLKVVGLWHQNTLSKQPLLSVG